jgi:hypothetical protein
MNGWTKIIGVTLTALTLAGTAAAFVFPTKEEVTEKVSAAKAQVEQRVIEVEKAAAAAEATHTAQETFNAEVKVELKEQRQVLQKIERTVERIDERMRQRRGR